MDTLVLMTAAYTGFLSLGTLLLGLSGNLTPQLLSCLLFFTTLFYLGAWPRLAQRRREEFKSLLPFAHLRMPLFFFFAISAAASLLSPPIFDELSYHLGLPFRYLTEQGIRSLPYNYYSNFPLNQEMLYIFGELFQGIYASRFINLFMGIFCALALVAIAHRHFEYESGMIGSLIFFSMICVSTLLPFAYNDFGLTFYSLVSLLCFLNWHDEGKPFWLAGAGALSGLALGTKYLGGINFIALFFLIVIVDVLKRTDRKQRFVNLCLFSFPALVLFSPWLIKNWMATGNPIYPFLYSIFGGQGWSALNDHRYFELMRSLYGPPGAGWQRYVNLPGSWLLDFTNNIAIGPILLFTVPLLFWLKNSTFKTKLLAGYSVIFVMIWGFGSMVNRFLLPGLAVFSLLSGVLFVRIEQKFIKNLVLAGIFIIFFLNIYGITTLSQDMGFVFTEARELVAMSTACNLLVKSDKKLLMAGEMRTYGFKCQVLAPSMFDTNYTELKLSQAKSPREFVQALRTDGIEYLLVNSYRIHWLQTKFQYFNDPLLLERFLVFMNSPYCREVFRSGNLILFRPEIPPRQSQPHQNT